MCRCRQRMALFITPLSTAAIQRPASACRLRSQMLAVCGEYKYSNSNHLGFINDAYSGCGGVFMTALDTTHDFDFALGQEVEGSFLGKIEERSQGYGDDGKPVNKYQVRLIGSRRRFWIEEDFLFEPEAGV